MPRIASAVTKLALLIDGDNVSASYMPLIMREAELIGVVAIRRIYGQFKSGKMKSWLKQLETFDLTSVNVSPLTRGKNATDMKLVIEAMDMLNGRQLDGFLIASSDGDFTPLVARIRASAVACYGFGMKKAPSGYKAEFDRFFECDTALAAEKKAAPRRAGATAPKPAAAAPARPTARPAPQPRRPTTPAHAAAGDRRDVPQNVTDAVLKIVRSRGGNATFRDIGNALPLEIPKFEAKAHGFGTTKALLKALHGKHGLEVTKDGQVALALT
jgi:hypothetical protein